MTIQQLEYLIALDNHRHFVKASKACHVTQPTLTMQVKKLEEEIGVKVFSRDQKPLTPTVAGEQIILKARQVLREVEQMKAFVSKETESLEGSYTLGVIPTLAPYLLPRFLPAFIDSHPETTLEIYELQTDEIIQRLHRGTLDMGLLVTPLEEKKLREVPVFYEPFLLYLPEGHPLMKVKKLTPDKLDTKDMLLLEEGHCFRAQALQVCHQRRKQNKRRFAYASGSIEALKGLVNQGLGYTLTPELSILDDPHKEHIKRFQAPEPVREVSLVVHHHFTKEALIEALREVVLEGVPERFKKIKKYTRVKWR